MTEAEYIAVLWKVIAAEGVIIGALVAAVWRHILEDRKVRVDLQRCKDALRLNGSER